MWEGIQKQPAPSLQQIGALWTCCGFNSNQPPESVVSKGIASMVQKFIIRDLAEMPQTKSISVLPLAPIKSSFLPHACFRKCWKGCQQQSCHWKEKQKMKKKQSPERKKFRNKTWQAKSMRVCACVWPRWGWGRGFYSHPGVWRKGKNACPFRGSDLAVRALRRAALRFQLSS